MKFKPILVTGSRALADTHEAKAWAIKVLRRELEGCTELWDGVCQNSPDAWAWEIVSSRDPLPRRMRYWADGRLYIEGVPTGMIVLRWKGDSVFHPLHRKDKMVSDFAKLHPEGVVLALRAPWSKTHGTEYTIREARLRKLAVREFVCPLEEGRVESTESHVHWCPGCDQSRFCSNEGCEGDEGISELECDACKPAETGTP